MASKDAVHGAVVAAKTRGTEGLYVYLQDHRLELPELLTRLTAPALLDATTHGFASGTGDVGLKIEVLSPRVQRELWSAFVRWKTMLPPQELRLLVERFLTVAGSPDRMTEADSVCVHLAQLLLPTEEEHDEEPLDALDAQLGQLVWLPSMQPYRKSTKKIHIAGDDSDDLSQSRKRRRSGDGYSTEDEDPAASSSQARRPKITLSPELEQRATTIAKQMEQVAAPDAVMNQSKVQQVSVQASELLQQVMNAVETTAAENESMFALLCTKLQLPSTSDEVLFHLTTALMEGNWSAQYAQSFLQAALLPRVLAATSVISRVLLQTVLLYAKPSYQTALIDGLIVPVLSTSGISSAQGEALTRILREKGVAAEQLDTLVNQSLSQSTSILANEAVVLVFQSVLNLKPSLSAATIERLITVLNGSVENEAEILKSAKFATLLFTLVSKYGEQCAAHADDLEAVATKLTSVMAKAALRAIQKLKS
ncbi:hypothetical protein Poli38472_006033 [Pythium oligandrum]|uniref:Fanconi Anaemia group E protein C-terminal domain-containing protein n=1 Tax=Pythium oligandrum TaxID=41045 RepID=A0A8K1FLS5_PYTOL|nr:hypothetical protein Poli38472_006033 [Pythium oligandrum]|eukprot:TMW68565.1 hypothetical protein Poli38472_006033 [Pythium oligandrum]